VPLGPIPLSIGRKISVISLYIILKKKEDILYEDMFLCALILSGEYHFKMFP